MRRLAVLTLAAVLIAALAAPAYADGRRHRHHSGSGTGTNVALGLASFAVFNQIMGPFLRSSREVVYERRVVYVPPTVIYGTAPTVIVASPPPPPPPPQVIHYPHGRYEFQGSQWVWFPNVPAPPPTPSTSSGQALRPGSGQAPPTAEPCQPTGKYVKTPYGFQPECR